MNGDHIAIHKAYNAGINNTTRNADSYEYAPKDYVNVRSENAENAEVKRRIATELNNMTKRASRGLKEDYMYIVSNMKKLHEDLSDVLKS